MTKKIFRTPSMTLGLALLLLGSEMNQVNAKLEIQWPNTTDYDDKPFKVYVLKLDGTLETVTKGQTKQGGTSSDLTYPIVHHWSDIQDGRIKIQVIVNSKKEAEDIDFYIPMSAWNKTDNHLIYTILNDTKLILDGTSYSGTVTYPN